MLNPIVTSLYRPPALVVPVITTNRPEKRPCASLFHYSESFNVEIWVENFIPAIFLRLPSAICSHRDLPGQSHDLSYSEIMGNIECIQMSEIPQIRALVCEVPPCSHPESFCGWLEIINTSVSEITRDVTSSVVPTPIPGLTWAAQYSIAGQLNHSQHRDKNISLEKRKYLSCWGREIIHRPAGATWSNGKQKDHNSHFLREILLWLLFQRNYRNLDADFKCS